MMTIIKRIKTAGGALWENSLSDNDEYYDDVYDDSKPCQYCGRYKFACDKQPPMMFGPHTLVYFDRGRSRRCVHTCRDCANAKQQFRGPPHLIRESPL